MPKTVSPKTRPRTKLEVAVLHTLCYYKVFNYSPSVEEVHRFLIGERATFKEVATFSHKLPKPPKQPTKILALQKLSLAIKRAALARFIPGVEAIFLTGDIAAGSAKTYSDLDFLVVCKDGWLNLARFLLTMVYSILGWRRSRATVPFISLISRIGPLRPMKESICLNIFLGESALTMPKAKRNLFIAHEIAFAKPVFDRGGVHQHFLYENRWALKYLPNAFTVACLPARQSRWPLALGKEKRSSSDGPRRTAHACLLSACRRGRARQGQLFLHKKDLTNEVLKRYNENCKT